MESGMEEEEQQSSLEECTTAATMMLEKVSLTSSVPTMMMEDEFQSTPTPASRLNGHPPAKLLDPMEIYKQTVNRYGTSKKKPARGTFSFFFACRRDRAQNTAQPGRDLNAGRCFQPQTPAAKS